MTKNEYKELLEHFRARSAYINKATIDSIVEETPEEQEARVKMLLKPDNYGLLFNYYFGKDTPLPMADSDCAWYHTGAYKDLYYNAYITLFNFVFRGGAKSTHANLGYSFALKQAEIMRFFLVVGANEPRSKMLLADLQAQFECNNRIIKDFGRQVSYGSWADGQFETNDRCAFMALGIDQPFRGLRLNGVRLQYVSVDDVEDPKRALNKRLVNEIADKVTGDLEGAFSKESQRMIVNNNYFNDKGVMAALLKRKGMRIESTRENLIRKEKYATLYLVNLTTRYPPSLGGDKNVPVEPSWKERYSAADCERIIEKYTHDKPTLYRENYNTPFTVGKIFKKDWIRMVRPKPIEDYLVLVANWDFAYSEQGCFKGMALLGVDETRMTVLDIFCNQNDIEAAMEYHFKMAKRIVQVNSSAVFYYDASVAQESIYEPILLRAARKYRSVQIPMPQKSNTDKYLKIEATLTSPLSSGLLAFSEELESHPDWEEAKHQLLGFEKGCKTPVDFPDALADTVLKAQEYLNMGEEDEDHSTEPVIGTRKRGGY